LATQLQHRPQADFACSISWAGLYSLYDSIRFVLEYLDDVDPKSAKVARERYGCLTPWQSDPAIYGHAALTGRYPTCEADVVHALSDLLQKREAYAAHDGERFLDAVQNARLVTNAERYYRIMYYGSRASWNLRDEHMFNTLKTLLAYHGERSKGIVWAHNSHIGNAEATEMSARGEHNIGQLCRKEFGQSCYAIGFGTDHGTVAAASEWGGRMEIKDVRPSVNESVERLCHESVSRRTLWACSACSSNSAFRAAFRAMPRPRHLVRFTKAANSDTRWHMLTAQLLTTPTLSWPAPLRRRGGNRSACDLVAFQ
jgi:erythromycin esterase-like protein